MYWESLEKEGRKLCTSYSKSNPFLLCFIVLAFISDAYSMEVLVNRPESIFDTRYDYPHTLLQMIFDETEKDYGKASVGLANHVMSRNRLLLELEKGKEVHVVAEAPKPGWVQNLITIRIPIRKGLQGYRLFFINSDDQEKISANKDFASFKLFPTGSGAEWSTARVMRDGGFNVVTGTNYEGLFSMLEKKRFITFGRGINEIESEYESHKKQYPNLAIDKDFAVYIKLPTYYFVSPQKPELAKRIETGLKALIKNGEFDKYFDLHHKELINKFRLKERTIFPIKNSNLTAEDPIDITDYWYQIAP